ALDDFVPAVLPEPAAQQLRHGGPERREKVLRRRIVEIGFEDGVEAVDVAAARRDEVPGERGQAGEAAGERVGGGAAAREERLALLAGRARQGGEDLTP